MKDINQFNMMTDYFKMLIDKLKKTLKHIQITNNDDHSSFQQMLSIIPDLKIAIPELIITTTDRYYSTGSKAMSIYRSCGTLNSTTLSFQIVFDKNIFSREVYIIHGNLKSNIDHYTDVVIPFMEISINLLSDT